MFIEIKVCNSDLFTNFIGCYAGAVGFPLSDIILAQLACPMSNVKFCLHLEITNLSLYKHWAYPSGASFRSSPLMQIPRFVKPNQAILNCTIDLLFDQFGISCKTTDNFCFYSQNRLIQTSETGDQQYSDASPFSIPWPNVFGPGSKTLKALLANTRLD